MPLHDWTERHGWDGFHQLWIVALLHGIKPELPEGYRAYLGTVPALAVGLPPQRPDVHVRSEASAQPGTQVEPVTAAVGISEDEQPDEQVAVLALEEQLAVHVVQGERLVAAVELISPCNKDRPEPRDAYRSRYVSYLYQGVHLLLVDVHRRPLKFSFADAVAAALGFAQANLPAPFAISYRVGSPAATGGKVLDIWRRPLAVGTPLPTMKLALTADITIPFDLERTYMNAAADAYLTQ